MLGNEKNNALGQSLLKVQDDENAYQSNSKGFKSDNSDDSDSEFGMGDEHPPVSVPINVQASDEVKEEKEEEEPLAVTNKDDLIHFLEYRGLLTEADEMDRASIVSNYSASSFTSQADASLVHLRAVDNDRELNNVVGNQMNDSPNDRLIHDMLHAANHREKSDLEKRLDEAEKEAEKLYKEYEKPIRDLNKKLKDFMKTSNQKSWLEKIAFYSECIKEWMASYPKCFGESPLIFAIRCFMYLAQLSEMAFYYFSFKTLVAGPKAAWDWLDAFLKNETKKATLSKHWDEPRYFNNAENAIFSSVATFLAVISVGLDVFAENARIATVEFRKAIYFSDWKTLDGYGEKTTNGMGWFFFTLMGLAFGMADWAIVYDYVQGEDNAILRGFLYVLFLLVTVAAYAWQFEDVMQLVKLPSTLQKFIQAEAQSRLDSVSYGFHAFIKMLYQFIGRASAAFFIVSSGMSYLDLGENDWRGLTAAFLGAAAAGIVGICTGLDDAFQFPFVFAGQDGYDLYQTYRQNNPRQYWGLDLPASQKTCAMVLNHIVEFLSIPALAGLLTYAPYFLQSSELNAVGLSIACLVSFAFLFGRIGLYSSLMYAIGFKETQEAVTLYATLEAKSRGLEEAIVTLVNSYGIEGGVVEAESVIQPAEKVVDLAAEVYGLKKKLAAGIPLEERLQFVILNESSSALDRAQSALQVAKACLIQGEQDEFPSLEEPADVQGWAKFFTFVREGIARNIQEIMFVMTTFMFLFPQLEETNARVLYTFAIALTFSAPYQLTRYLNFVPKAEKYILDFSKPETRQENIIGLGYDIANTCLFKPAGRLYDSCAESLVGAFRRENETAEDAVPYMAFQG